MIHGTWYSYLHSVHLYVELMDRTLDVGAERAWLKMISLSQW